MSRFKQQIRLCTGHDGVRIAFAITGHGPPLVKVSNWFSHLEFDVASPVWSHMIAELSREHMLLRYDQRGTGLSDWDVPSLCFEDWVRDLETVVDALELERFPLLGISQGGSVAVAYAVRHPERVSHLILHGAYARGRLKRSPTPQMREEAEMLNKLAEFGWGQQNPAFRQFFTSLFIPDGTHEQHHWFNELARTCTSPTNAARMMRVFNEIDVVELLPQVSCPALVLHAVGDARVPFDEGRLFATQIRDARFIPLDSNNHLILESERAWERWVEEVHGFLPFAPVSKAVFPVLTPRERDLLELIAQGRDNMQIAAFFGLSEKTVRNHISSIYTKLEVESRAQAVVMGREAGFGKKHS